MRKKTHLLVPKLFERHPEGPAKMANARNLKDSVVAKLLDDDRRIKSTRSLINVWTDASVCRCVEVTRLLCRF